MNTEHPLSKKWLQRYLQNRLEYQHPKFYKQYDIEKSVFTAALDAIKIKNSLETLVEQEINNIFMN